MQIIEQNNRPNQIKDNWPESLSLQLTPLLVVKAIGELWVTNSLDDLFENCEDVEPVISAISGVLEIC